MIELKIYLDDDKNIIAVNDETGEIVETLKKHKATTKKTTTKKDENPNPEIVLETNKYVLNTAALTLLNVEAGDRIEIRYIHGDPCIGKNSAFNTQGGNKLNASGSVSFRGKSNEELSKFGDLFTLQETDKEGVFKMCGNTPELPKETEEIANPDDIDDLDDLIEEDDTETINDFKFNI